MVSVCCSGPRLTFLTLQARNQQNISAIIAHEGIEALLFMVSNTYPLIERQAITCAFQALRVLLFHEAANVLLAQNNIDDIVMSLVGIESVYCHCGDCPDPIDAWTGVRVQKRGLGSI